MRPTPAAFDAEARGHRNLGRLRTAADRTKVPAATYALFAPILKTVGRPNVSFFAGVLLPGPLKAGDQAGVCGAFCKGLNFPFSC